MWDVQMFIAAGAGVGTYTYLAWVCTCLPRGRQVQKPSAAPAAKKTKKNSEFLSIAPASPRHCCRKEGAAAGVLQPLAQLPCGPGFRRVQSMGHVMKNRHQDCQAHLTR